jgi:hypothetical protein
VTPNHFREEAGAAVLNSIMPEVTIVRKNIDTESDSVLKFESVFDSRNCPEFQDFLGSRHRFWMEWNSWGIVFVVFKWLWII